MFVFWLCLLGWVFVCIVCLLLFEVWFLPTYCLDFIVYLIVLLVLWLALLLNSKVQIVGYEFVLLLTFSGVLYVVLLDFLFVGLYICTCGWVCVCLCFWCLCFAYVLVYVSMALSWVVS